MTENVSKLENIGKKGIFFLVGTCGYLWVPVGTCWYLLAPVGTCWHLLVPQNEKVGPTHQIQGPLA